MGKPKYCLIIESEKPKSFWLTLKKAKTASQHHVQPEQRHGQPDQPHRRYLHRGQQEQRLKLHGQPKQRHQPHLQPEQPH